MTTEIMDDIHDAEYVQHLSGALVLKVEPLLPLPRGEVMRQRYQRRNKSVVAMVEEALMGLEPPRKEGNDILYHGARVVPEPQEQYDLVRRAVTRAVRNLGWRDNMPQELRKNRRVSAVAVQQIETSDGKKALHIYRLV